MRLFHRVSDALGILKEGFTDTEGIYDGKPCVGVRLTSVPRDPDDLSLEPGVWRESAEPTGAVGEAWSGAPLG